MKTKTICPDLADYQTIKKIYERSFPADERMPFAMFQDLLDTADTSFLAFYDEEQLCGFAHLFHFEDYSIIDYLAVNPDIRAQGYGSKMLQTLEQHFPQQTLIVEIEHPSEADENQEERLKRRHFYHKNGYQSSGYHIDFADLRYDIYVSKGKFLSDKYYKVYAQSFPNHSYKPVKNDD